MIGSLMMCLSVVILLIGILAGIAMGIQQNFTLAPAHAHLYLIGGVLLFLFVLFYRLVPASGTTTLAKVQVWLHMIGAIVFRVGVSVVLTKVPSFGTEGPCRAQGCLPRLQRRSRLHRSGYRGARRP